MTSDTPKGPSPSGGRHPKDKGDPLSQSELDKLIANTAADADAPAQSGKLSPDELDALITAAMSEVAGGGEAPLSQAELDQLLEQEQAAAPPPASEPPAPQAEERAGAGLSQEELDQLLAEAEREPAKPPSSGKVTQDELDALISGQLAEQGAASEDAGALTQEQLDQILAKEAGEPPAPAPPQAPPPAHELPPEKRDVLSQEDLDALMAAQLDEEEAGADHTVKDKGPLDQSAIDALMAEAGGGAAVGQPAEAAKGAGSGEGALNQEELDALLNQADADKPLDNSHLDAPLVYTGASDASNAPLDQSDIDSLIAAAGAETDAPMAEAPESEQALAPGSDDEQMDQAAIDGLVTAAGPEPAEAAAGPLDQSMIDALVASAGDAPESPQTAAPPPAGAGLDQSAIDAIAASAQQDYETATAPESGAETQAGDGGLDQGMIDAIISSAQGEAAPSASQGAGAGTDSEPPGGLLTQDDLDALIAQAQVQQKERQAATQEALAALPDAAGPAEEAPPAKPLLKFPKWPKKPPRQPTAVEAYVQRNFLKTVTSVAAMLVATLATFTYLYTHQVQKPSGATLAAMQQADLKRAMELARQYLDEGAYGHAEQVLEEPLAAAPPSPLRVDAEYVQLEAKYKQLPDKPTEIEAETFLAALNGVVDRARTHPRASEAMMWKADLFRRSGILYAALDVCRDVLTNFGEAPNLDKVLMTAGAVSQELGKPKDAAAYMQRLLKQTPGSPLASEAKMFLADAYAEAGNPDDARTLYVRIAQMHPDDAMGAKAYGRLGKLDLEQGRYESAIRQLERRINLATTVEGNDEVYLQLAQAYEATGDLQKARSTLSELIDFFAESDTTPKAFIALSQVLEKLGQRDDALRTAALASSRYRKNPAVLTNHGALLEAAGEKLSAARAYVAAHEAGANNPQDLLKAGRFLRNDGKLAEAREVLAQVDDDFPTTAAAFDAGIELAEVEFQQGHVAAALDTLEDLALVTQGKPQRLPVLLALGQLYEDLGLHERTAAIYRDVALLSTDPPVLARAAAALLKAGRYEDGLALANRLDLQSLPDAKAYDLLLAEGNALLGIDPHRALERLEQAYDAYPGQRTPAGDQRLLEAYLTIGNAARARAMVAQAEARMRRGQLAPADFQRAAAAYADYLYGQRDFRAAADAYALALAAEAPESKEREWAVFQRANALRKLADYEGSQTLYAELAGTDSDWAEEAGVMADYTRLEMRLRGAPPGETREEG